VPRLLFWRRKKPGLLPGPPAAPLLEFKPAGAVSRRSVLLGLLGVVIICGLTPYNDYALDNTFLVGNNLPIGVVMLTFLFVIGINGPLRRWRPTWALSSGELAVSLSMTLVSCALPSSGLMRYFPPSLVSPFYHALSDRQFADILQSLNLPKWLFPSFSGRTPRDWMTDPIVIDYIGRWTEPGAPPYLAWVKPALTWGVFLFALYGSLMCMIAIVRRQWFENERLPFPLVQIHLTLIEEPERGRMLNRVMRLRSFWIAFAMVFLLHGWNGLSHYFPKYFPLIPVYYDVLFRIMSNPPWSYVTNEFKTASVFFTAVGVTYFLSNPVAFSLWFFFLAMQIWRMIQGTRTGDPTIYGFTDQHCGGVAAYIIAVLWVGRRHWKMVIAQAFRGHRDDEPRERYLPYPLAFWGFIGCIAIMIGWLWLAGATFGGATLMVLLMVTLFIVITRIIAESGLIHGQLQVPINYPWAWAAMYGHPLISPVKTYYLASMLQSVHYDFREVVPVYASHGTKLLDVVEYGSRDSRYDTDHDRASGRKIILLLMLALLVGYIVSFGSTLWMEYRYAWTQDTIAKLPNDWGAYNNPKTQIVDAVVQYSTNNYHARESPASNFVFGFLLVGALSAMRLRFAWWPLHPIGFLMLYTYPGIHLWLSILIGWLAKTLILRFGGPKMYTDAKPFFMGLIVGESVAAGFWLALGVLLNALSLPYRPVNIMPG
jgi:hypothetical protein